MNRINHPTFPNNKEEQLDKINIIFDYLKNQDKKLGKNSEILEIDLITEDNLYQKVEKFIN